MEQALFFWLMKVMEMPYAAKIYRLDRCTVALSLWENHEHLILAIIFFLTPVATVKSQSFMAKNNPRVYS